MSWTSRPPARRSAGIRLASLMVLASSALGACATSSGLGRAAAILHDDSRFGNGPAAGEAFASMAGQLLHAAQQCRGGKLSDRCAALYEAAAGAEITGGRLLTCTAPGVYAARADWHAYLDRLARYERHPAGGRPQLPAVRAC